MRFALLVPVAASASFFLVSCGDDASTYPDPVDAGTETAFDGDSGIDPITDAMDALMSDVPDVPDVSDAPDPVCGTGNRPLPSGLTEIAWDDGEAVASLRDQTWSIEINGKSYDLNQEVLWEAVRFDLPHPALIHGFSVQWAGLPEDAPAQREIFAGLYQDFGYNGFDFWQPDPLWSGSRCIEDIQEGTWIDYVFDTPIEVPHPGLVYVAHRIDDAETPVFPFDGTTSGSGQCDTFSACHSAMNLPEVETSTFFNGVSFPFQNDYLVRLHVAFTEALKPEDRIFQPVPFQHHSHVSFGDYDHDGWDDLIADGPTLYRNDGSGNFIDVTEASGIAAMGIVGTGGIFGDYDNDGCLDLFIFAESTSAPDSLLRSNCDGTFTDVTEVAGLMDEQSYNDCGGDPANIRSPTAAAAWVDIDADGYLDLYLANFICWSQESYYVDTVFRNRGDGTFESWTGKYGFSPMRSPSRGVAPVDYDGDGFVDLFVNAYRLRANQLFRNVGDGTVSEKAISAGVAGSMSMFYYGHTIGAAWGDLDNDGDFDLISANLAHPRFFHFSDKTEVLLQKADNTFEDISGDWQRPESDAGLRFQETHSVPALADFDQDGNLDLIITCVYDGRPTDFYWGQGDGTFVLDSYTTGITTENGWGIAVSDFDNDGDPDVFAGIPFVNRLEGSGKGRWVQVRTIGNVDSNWNGIGATVRVTSEGVTRMRHVQGGTGKGGQDSQYLHFGLGDAEEVSKIEVTFPGGKSVDFPGPFATNQRIWAFEDGTIHLGWAPPGK